MKIVTIGGGTGGSLIDESLCKKYKEITAVVTSFDDGGSSGILRKDFATLPYGDIRRRIFAQKNIENDILEKIYEHRFGGEDLDNENFLETFFRQLDDFGGNPDLGRKGRNRKSL
jgi:uncharacterized cofD-like protein